MLKCYVFFQPFHLYVCSYAFKNMCICRPGTMTHACNPSASQYSGAFKCSSWSPIFIRLRLSGGDHILLIIVFPMRVAVFSIKVFKWVGLQWIFPFSWWCKFSSAAPGDNSSLDVLGAFSVFAKSWVVMDLMSLIVLGFYVGSTCYFWRSVLALAGVVFSYFSPFSTIFSFVISTMVSIQMMYLIADAPWEKIKNKTRHCHFPDFFSVLHVFLKRI